MIQYYDMDFREIQQQVNHNLAREGAANRANGHIFIKLQIGNDRGRTQRLVCQLCSNIGAHRGTNNVRKKRQTSYMCNICQIPLHINCFNVYHRVNFIQLFEFNNQTTLTTPIRSASKRNRSQRLLYLLIFHHYY